MSDIKFIDTSTEVKDLLVKLSKTALKKGGKAAGQKIKENTSVRTSKLRDSIGQWARIDKQTGQPELQIGYFSKPNMRKKGKKPPFAKAHWLEFGIKPHIISVKNKNTLTDGITDFGKIVSHPGFSGKNTLRNSVMNNVNLIRAAQEETLALLSEELEKAKGYVDESEEDELI